VPALGQPFPLPFPRSQDERGWARTAARKSTSAGLSCVDSCKARSCFRVAASSRATAPWDDRSKRLPLLRPDIQWPLEGEGKGEVCCGGATVGRVHCCGVSRSDGGGRGRSSNCAGRRLNDANRVTWSRSQLEVGSSCWCNADIAEWSPGLRPMLQGGALGRKDQSRGASKHELRNYGLLPSTLTYEVSRWENIDSRMPQEDRWSADRMSSTATTNRRSSLKG